MYDEIGGPASNEIKFLAYTRFMAIMRWVFKLVISFYQ